MSQVYLVWRSHQSATASVVIITLTRVSSRIWHRNYVTAITTYTTTRRANILRTRLLGPWFNYTVPVVTNPNVCGCRGGNSALWRWLKSRVLERLSAEMSLSSSSWESTSLLWSKLSREATNPSSAGLFPGLQACCSVSKQRTMDITDLHLPQQDFGCVYCPFRFAIALRELGAAGRVMKIVGRRKLVESISRILWSVVWNQLVGDPVSSEDIFWELRSPPMHSNRSSEEQARHTWKSDQQQGGTFVLASRTGRWRLSATDALVEMTIEVAQEETFFLTNMTFGDIILDIIVDCRPPNGWVRSSAAVRNSLITTVNAGDHIISQFSRNNQSTTP